MSICLVPLINPLDILGEEVLNFYRSLLAKQRDLQ